MQILNRIRHRTAGDEPAVEVVLIVGLGNPGRKYANNRHNIGFQIADRWVKAHGLEFNKVQSKALIAPGKINNRRVIVAKPQTFMNDSGRAVGALLKFYKVPREQLVVIYDDLDLPFGTIRLRSDGGAGGHNGMRSIIQQLGGKGMPQAVEGVAFLGKTGLGQILVELGAHRGVAYAVPAMSIKEFRFGG